MPLIFGTYKLKLGGIVPTSNVFSKYLEEGIEQAVPVIGETYLAPIAIWKVRAKTYDGTVFPEHAEGFKESKATPFYYYQEGAKHLNSFKFQEAASGEGRMWDPVSFYWLTEPAQHLSNFEYAENAGNWTLGKAVPFYDMTIYVQTVNFLSKKVEESSKERLSLAIPFYMFREDGPGHNDDSFGLGIFKSQASWYEAFQFYTYYGNVPYQVEFDESHIDSANFSAYGQSASFHWYLLPAQNVDFDLSVKSEPMFKAYSTPAFFHWFSLPGTIGEFKPQNLVEDQTSENFAALTISEAFNTSDSYVYEFDDRLYPAGTFQYGKAVPFFYYTFTVNEEQFFKDTVEEGTFESYRKEAPFYYYEIFVDPENCFDQPHEEAVFKTYRLEPTFYYYSLNVVHEQGFDQPHEESVFDSYALAVPFYYNSIPASYELVFKDLRELGSFSGYTPAPGFFTFTNPGEVEYAMLKERGGWQAADLYVNTPTVKHFVANDYDSQNEQLKDELEKGLFKNYGQAVSFYLADYQGFSFEFKDLIEKGQFSSHTPAIGFYLATYSAKGWNPKFDLEAETSHSSFYSAIFYYDVHRGGANVTNNETDHTVTRFVSLRKADEFFSVTYQTGKDYFQYGPTVSSQSVDATALPFKFITNSAYAEIRMSVGRSSSIGDTGWLNTLWFLYESEAKALSRDVTLMATATSASISVPSSVSAAYYTKIGISINPKTSENIGGDTIPNHVVGTYLPLFERRSISVAVNEMVYGFRSDFLEYAQAVPFFTLTAWGNLDFGLSLQKATGRTAYVHIAPLVDKESFGEDKEYSYQLSQFYTPPVSRPNLIGTFAADVFDEYEGKAGWPKSKLMWTSISSFMYWQPVLTPMAYGNEGFNPFIDYKSKALIVSGSYEENTFANNFYDEYNAQNISIGETASTLSVLADVKQIHQLRNIFAELDSKQGTNANNWPDKIGYAVKLADQFQYNWQSILEWKILVYASVNFETYKVETATNTVEGFTQHNIFDPVINEAEDKFPVIRTLYI